MTQFIRGNAAQPFVLDETAAAFWYPRRVGPLPQELISHVMEILRDGRKSLEACPLTCKST